MKVGVESATLVVILKLYARRYFGGFFHACECDVVTVIVWSPELPFLSILLGVDILP